MSRAREIQSDTSIWLHVAMKKGFLSPQQANRCILACGQADAERRPFVMPEFLLQQGWLSQEQLHFLTHLVEEESQLQLDDSSVFHDVLQTMEQPVHSHSSGQTSDLHGIALGDTLGSANVPVVSKDTPPPRFDSVSLSTRVWQALSQEERYRVGRTLGQGGLGIVVEAEDRNLGRKVAKKSLLHGKDASPSMLSNFLIEARVTGLLEHPNIIPIYDLGENADHTPFYTMRLLPSRNLLDVMQEGETSLTQLLRILQQVCMGLEYAHSQAVVHRDIKPANILLGQFGEVVIADWGIAKVLDHKTLSNTDSSLEETSTHRLKGTPVYMAPEQIEQALVTPALDQYALGIILYQVLTGEPPFLSDNLFTLLYQICSQSPIPPSSRTPSRQIPIDVEQICMRMLSKDPKQRFSSCREVYERLEEFLEGTKDRERRHIAAMTRVEAATKLSEQYRTLYRQSIELHQAWETASRQIDSWVDIEEKRTVWNQEEAYQHAQRESERIFGSAIQTYSQALEHEPGNALARAGLADLYWERFVEAEKSQDELSQIYYHELIRLYDDGRYSSLLEGTGQLTLETQPCSSVVDIYRYVERDRRLLPELLQQGLHTPFSVALAMGSYMLHIQAEGYRSVHLPLFIERCGQVSPCVCLYTEQDIGNEFVYIPGGGFSYGDPHASMGLPAQWVELDDFFMGRHPVTMGEYLTFLNELHSTNPALATKMLPRSGQEVYAHWDNRFGQYIPTRETLFHGKIAEMYPAEHRYEWELPVFGVSWFDAIQYCRWRSHKENRFITLPTEEQWEKAGRGVDRRIFPWGNKFEATYCKMGRSRPPEYLQPEPIGIFAEDQSPYGMMDVVGTVAEWTLSLPLQTVLSLQEEPQDTVFFRGGGWIASQEVNLRLGTRVPKPANTASYNCGFRLVAYPPHTGSPSHDGFASRRNVRDETS